MTLKFEHPLRWPVGWPRTSPGKRRRAAYKVTLAQSVVELEGEIKRLGVRDAVVSSDVPLRRDGRPYGEGDPKDPGVAVYWTALNQPRAMALDRWDSYRANVRAAGLAFEALRSFERTGAGHILERVYAGFAQLPADAGQGMPARPWREVLGLDGLAGPAFAVRAAVEAAYKSLAAKLHPDVPGGDPQAFVELHRAREEALREVGEG